MAFVLGELGPADVAIATAPAVFTFLAAIVGLLVARRRRLVEDTAVAVSTEDDHAKAALAVLTATIVAQRDTEAHMVQRHATEREQWERDRAALVRERDDAIEGRERERRWKHKARGRAHYWTLRAELAEGELARAGIARPDPPPPPVDLDRGVERDPDG